MTSLDTYKLKRVLRFIDDMTLIKYNIYTITELNQRHKPELISMIMDMQGKHNALINSLKELLLEVKYKRI